MTTAPALICMSGAVCYVAVVAAAVLQGGPNALLYLALLLLGPTDLCLIVVSNRIKQRRISPATRVSEPDLHDLARRLRD